MNQLPEFLEKSARRSLDLFCRQAHKNPEKPRKLHYDVAGLKILIFESRYYRDCSNEHKELPIAQLSYIPELNQWSLHYQNGEHWQLYLNITPTLNLDRLLIAIAQDPLGLFWQD